MDWDIPLSTPSPRFTAEFTRDFVLDIRQQFSSPSPDPEAEDSATIDGASDSYSHDLALRPIASGLSFTTAFNCEHRYPLRARDKECATVVMRSRSHNPDMPPTYYMGDEISGHVALPRANLSSITRVDVVLLEYVAGSSGPVAETRRSLVPEELDSSSIKSKGHIEWPFTMTPMREAVSDSASVSGSSGSSGHRRFSNFSIATRSSRDSHQTDACQITVTAHRRGLQLKAVWGQRLTFITSSDGKSPTSPLGFLGHDPVLRSPKFLAPVVERRMQELHPVVIKGLLFRTDPVEVHCQLGIAIPLVYAVGESIPLSMTLTTPDRPAVDLLAVSQAIDVRLFKTMAFGKNAHEVAPSHRATYKRKECVGFARWVPEGSEQLPPAPGESRPRWRVRLRGKLPTHEDAKVSSMSFEYKHMAMMYTVCLFPFKARDFHPFLAADKELVILKLTLTHPSRAEE